MQYMIIAMEAEEDFARRDPANQAAFAAYMKPWMDYSTAMREAGKTLSGNALEGPETATTIKVRDGKRIVEDGPYADSREQLGGYFIIEADSFEDAKAWAAKCPSTAKGKTEVRQVMMLPEGA